MPYKSDAQRRFFHAAEARGDIKQSTVNEFDKESKGMKLPEHVKKLYEGGLIDEHEYNNFKARYHNSEGEEHIQEQQHPDMEPEEGSKYEPHHEGELPEAGYDRYMTEEPGDEYPEEHDEDALSRQEYMKALKRRRRE